MTFTDLLQELRVPYVAGGQHRHVTQGWLGIKNCPYCGSQDHHLGYNVRYGYLNCWRCGPHNVAKTVALLSGVDVEVVKGKLGNLAGPKLERGYEPKGEYLPPQSTGPLLGMHRRYLESRGLDPDEIARLWRVGGIGFTCHLTFRLFIPVYYHGVPVSWTTRTIKDGGLRYVSAKRTEEAISHKRLLYGEDLTGHSVVVCEGPLDAWKVGPGAVSLFGCGYSRAQVVRLAKYASRAIVFDADRAGRTQAERLADDLSAFPGETLIVKLTTGKDPASADPGELAELRERFLT